MEECALQMLLFKMFHKFVDNKIQYICVKSFKSIYMINVKVPLSNMLYVYTCSPNETCVKSYYKSI